MKVASHTKCRSHNGGQAGFTLVELMVVIAIIGILAAIATVNFTQYRRRAFAVSTVSELRSMATAFEAFFATNERYPPNAQQGTMPPGMAGLIAPGMFSNPPPLGGTYDYEGPDTWAVAGIGVRGLSGELSGLLDRVGDDGDPTTGNLRTIIPGNIGYVLCASNCL